MKTAKIYQTPCVEVLEIVALAATMNISAGGPDIQGVDSENHINNGTEIL